MSVDYEVAVAPGVIPTFGMYPLRLRPVPTTQPLDVRALQLLLAQTSPDADTGPLDLSELECYVPLARMHAAFWRALVAQANFDPTSMPAAVNMTAEDGPMGADEAAESLPKRIAAGARTLGLGLAALLALILLAAVAFTLSGALATGAGGLLAIRELAKYGVPIMPLDGASIGIMAWLALGICTHTLNPLRWVVLAWGRATRRRKMQVHPQTAA